MARWWWYVLLGAVPLSAQTTPWPAALAGGPESLWRRVEGGLVTTQAVPGGSVERRVSWLAEGRVARVESVVRGSAAPAPVVELAFRAGVSDSGFARLRWGGEAEWYGSPFWTGPDWTRVGRDWHHPGENTPSVRCWRAAADCRATVTGRVRKLHLAGDGVRASIRHNDREVWRAELEGTDGTGVEPQLSLELKRGDTLRFIVHKRGAIACDTTGWDPLITTADGQVFQASRSFGPQQDRDGWSYEQEGSGAVPVGPLQLTLLDAHLALRVAPLALGQTTEGDGRELLPGCVLAEGERSGVVLTAETAGTWTLRAESGRDGLVRLALWATPAADGKLPPALLTTYDGPPTAGLLALAQRLADRVRPALHELTAPLAKRPELDLLLLAQHEWRREDRLVETAEGYAAAAANHLARGQALAAKLGRPVAWPAAAEGLDAQRRRWLHTRLRKRDLLLGQPLVTGDPLLLCTRAQPSYSHLVAQYFGWRQRPGGGLFVLELPGVSLRVRDVLGAQLPAGSVLEPSLSFDGRRIAFSFVATPAQPLASTALPVNEEGGEEGYFHLYEVGVDGRGLRQLTSGRYDDLMPCWLPDGALAFVSTRRRGYSRCFGPNFSRRWHSYTLHRLEPGGGEPRILSLNDVSEWFPSLAHDGRLLFARWDYIDRDAVTHQNLWAARPDGTNPVAVWGNALPKPHCTFQARAVPGSPKLAFIASAHHAITGGPLCLLDPRAGANSLAALQRLTPGPLPEAEPGAVGEYYNAPWPLSEDLFLVAYSPERLIFEGQGPNPDHALGIYLLDAAGNRELLYRDPLLGATNPQPLTPRAAPPLLPSSVDPRGSAEGEMVLADVYQGLPGVPRGTVKELRVVQIHPKTTWLANAPKIGIAGEENTRTILGTVPVDPDGSARFVVPAHAAVLFQALDADGCAVQTMRSITWVQPGEQVSCIGCHERQRNAPPAGRVPLALGRPASRLTPGELGGRPFAYAEVVQPVLDKHCVRCHGGPEPKRGIVLTGEPLNGFSRSYLALCGDRASGLVPCFPQRNQVQLTPVGGRHGALGSKLVKMLRAGHQKVVLSPGELRRIVTWIDLNAVFLGSYQSDKAQQSD